MSFQEAHQMKAKLQGTHQGDAETSGRTPDDSEASGSTLHEDQITQILERGPLHRNFSKLLQSSSGFQSYALFLLVSE